jgi:5-methylcytosine-specific restriction endonuclease McrA
VSPVRRLCLEPDCRDLTAGDPHRCPRHAAEFNARRRHTYRSTIGKHWRGVRQLALARDGHRCQKCGTTDDLTVHLDPRMRGDHDSATVEACITLCRSCHGRLDAPRAAGAQTGWKR